MLPVPLSRCRDMRSTCSGLAAAFLLQRTRWAFRALEHLPLHAAHLQRATTPRRQAVRTSPFPAVTAATRCESPASARAAAAGCGCTSPCPAVTAATRCASPASARAAATGCGSAPPARCWPARRPPPLTATAPPAAAPRRCTAPAPAAAARLRHAGVSGSLLDPEHQVFPAGAPRRCTAPARLRQNAKDVAFT